MRYICKGCGAESPEGIGYAGNGQTVFPAPAADCPNPHAPRVPDTVSAWHRTYQRGLITLGELAEELARLDRRHGPQAVAS